MDEYYVYEIHRLGYRKESFLIFTDRLFLTTPLATDRYNCMHPVRPTDCLQLSPDNDDDDN